MSDPDLIDDEEESTSEVLEASVDAPDVRLDKALAEAFPALSRARLQALLAEGAVTRDGQAIKSGSAKATPGARPRPASVTSRCAIDSLRT